MPGLLSETGGHPFEPKNPFYDFKRGQVKAINKPYKTVVENAQGSIYVPKKMRDRYVFVDRLCGDAEAAFGEGGMIRLGNPKYSFGVERGKIRIEMA